MKKSIVIQIIFSVIISLMCISCETSSIPQYEIINLGIIFTPMWDPLDPFGGLSSQAYAINDAGQVVGSSTMHSFLWDADAGMRSLPRISRFETFGAYDINEVGQIVGQARLGICIWDPNGATTFIESGFYNPGRKSVINNLGQVAGYMPGPQNKGRHAFFWERAGDLRDLDPLGGSYSYALGINDHGQIVGTSNHHSFLWDNENGMRQFAKFDQGIQSYATDINNVGQIVGYTTNRPSDPNHNAFIWDSINGLRFLDTLGHQRNCPAAINQSGQVVGYMVNRHENSHAFLWGSENGMVDLNDFLGTHSDWKILTYANDINNKGQIVGYGQTKDDQRRAFIMTPILILQRYKSSRNSGGMSITPFRT